jgi:hypothetical protein
MNKYPLVLSLFSFCNKLCVLLTWFFFVISWCVLQTLKTRAAEAGASQQGASQPLPPADPLALYRQPAPVLDGPGRESSASLRRRLEAFVWDAATTGTEHRETKRGVPSQPAATAPQLADLSSSLDKIELKHGEAKAREVMAKCLGDVHRRLGLELGGAGALADCRRLVARTLGEWAAFARGLL